jgi:hypothetical protein
LTVVANPLAADNVAVTVAGLSDPSSANVLLFTLRLTVGSWTSAVKTTGLPLGTAADAESVCSPVPVPYVQVVDARPVDAVATGDVETLPADGVKVTETP